MDLSLPVAEWPAQREVRCSRVRKDAMTPRSLLRHSESACAPHGIERCTICLPRYRTIVADPPWPYPQGFMSLGTNHRIKGRDRTPEERGPMVRKPLPYAAMTLAEIQQLPVPALADDDARLFLWATARYLTDAVALLSHWGFSYRQLLVWDKTPNFSPLPAHVAPNAAEFLLVAVKGSPARTGTWPSSVIRARKARTEHSRKPDVFLDMVETVSPGPYLEMFARRDRLGWHTWGNESLGTAEAAA